MLLIIFVCAGIICGCTTIGTLNHMKKTPFINESSEYLYLLTSENSWKQIHAVSSPPVTFNNDSVIYQASMRYKIINKGTFDSSIEFWCSKESNVFDSGEPVLKLKISALKELSGSVPDDYISSLLRQEFFYTGVKSDSGNIEIRVIFTASGDYHQ